MEGLALTATLRPSALDARRGVVRVHGDVLAALGARPFTPLTITGARTTTVLAALAPNGVSREELCCDELVLANLGVVSGQPVSVAVAPPLPAVSLQVAGAPEVAVAVRPDVLRQSLLGKAVTTGDNVSLLPQDLALPDGVTGAMVTSAGQQIARSVGPTWTSVLLTITEATPPGSIVTMGTVVGWSGGASTEGSATPLAEAPTTHELPGLEQQVSAMTEWFQLGFHKADLLKQLGTAPSMGVLLTGPAGSGKQAAVRAAAAQVRGQVVHLWCPSTAALEPNAAAGSLRTAFAQAARVSSGVLLLEDVEALAPRDGQTPLTTVLLELVRAAVAEGRLAVVCTSSRPEAVSTELRQPGLLDHELSIALPDKPLRRRLLDAATRSVPLGPDVDLDDVAARTPGFVAADVIALMREAGLRAAMRDPSAQQVTRADVDAALEVVHPTAMGGSAVDVGSVSLDDVGDMAEVKQALTEAVVWPLSFPETFDRMGVTAPRGVLLYGPPGCGKTFLIRALAGTGQANLLSVKGAELLDKWVGESERAVRELFRRAREAAPTIVFLDEVDALAPTRGQSSDSGVSDRVVAALLTELDGVEALRDVVVVGATNRPDLIDPALLRPGRLERLVFVPPPDAAARADVLRAVSRKVPLDPSVDLDQLAAQCEGFSAADCAALVREAALTAMRESMQAPTVTAAHVQSALTRVRPSLDPAQVQALAEYADKRAAR